MYHGLATRFSDFKQYVEAEAPDIYDKMEEYLVSLDENWCNLEEALADLDVDMIIDHAVNFLVGYGADDWSDSYHHDYQYEIEQVVQAISSGLKDQFYNWLQQIEIPDYKKDSFTLLKINRAAKFLSFNYTPTLQEVYGVKESEIVHIHGVKSDTIDDVILGHGWSQSDRPHLNEEQNIDTRVMEGNHIIDGYFKDTFKPTDELIQRHKQFFLSLIQVTEIYVWGHSLSDVDMPYFSAIEKMSKQSNPIWHISYYSDSSVSHNKATMVRLGVPASRIKHHKLDQYHVVSKT